LVELRAEIARVAPTDSKVLITGESGVGKEVVSRAVHHLSRRAGNAFVEVNCAGLSETLLETELFGHIKGSFTGAYRDKIGKLDMAHRGTLFLDEVGEMTLRMQGLLLRFLETGEIQKVGSDAPTGRVNVRVIAATNKNLPELIELGRFREDLFYRLNVIHLWVPPLRERLPDIPVLVEHFIRAFGEQIGCSPERITPEAMAALMEYHWPGNIRELQNVVERIVVNVRHEVVTLDKLPSDIRKPVSSSAPANGARQLSVADKLYKTMREERQSFWSAVYPLYMQRDITRDDVRDLVRRGLEDARGNYRIVAQLFNLEQNEYKKFLNFLRQHQCHLPFRAYRQLAG
jgi:transcriptional regulator with PAS, ATPase and Fis domain